MHSLHSELFFIALAAALAPLLTQIPKSFRMPVLVAEILLGMLIGPHMFNMVSTDGLVALLGELGLTYLLFMVGLEIDLDELHGKPLNLAISGWLLSFIIAMLFMYIFHSIGLITAPPILAAVAVSTTALGIVAPILREAGTLNSSFGKLLLPAAAMGEFGPLMVISFLLIPTHSSVWHTLLMLAFVCTTILLVDMAIRVRSSPWMDLISQTMKKSGQFPVRICIAVQAMLVALAATFGINIVIGAFAAGLVVNLSMRGEGGEVLRQKLDAIGYGFLIPMFFIVAGVRFDISALWASPLVPVQIICLLGLILLVRGVPVLLYNKLLSAEEKIPFAFYSATGLPLIVIISEIGVSSGLMSADRGAVLVCTGMISVLLFPILAHRFIEEAKQEISIEPSDDTTN
ncbi:MAG: cation:proton antiporter [Methylomonas lenta]|nr:cation:proton antiporter [Methylomonas lenta]